jgi:predicted NUDIX family phosphoesterase
VLEEVYCLPAGALPAPTAEVIPLSAELYQLLLSEGRFLPRAEVEDDPRWRQIIPYAVVERNQQALLVERLSGGSETRLHHRYSLGIGGHINRQDAECQVARDLLTAALTRELREELVIGAFFAEAVGLIHSDANPVDRVHTGVLYLVKTLEATVREQHKLRGAWAGLGEVAALEARLEGWSQLALRWLYQSRRPRSC